MLIRIVPIAALSLFTICAVAYSRDCPKLALKTESGEIQLDSLRGKVLYLDFWASWCKPCRESFPFMNETARLYRERDFAIIAVNLDKKRSVVDAFLKDNPAEFSIAFDTDGLAATAFRVSAMPSTFIIDRDGQIVFEGKGFRDKERKQIYETLQKLMNEQPTEIK